MILRFGPYKLIPATRELWHGTQQLRPPRRVFDALVYLIANRDRAVSKDELILKVWNRSNVSDVQLNQLIVRARRILGDDGQIQKTIRTVPGFGYRWILPLEEMPALEGPPDDTTGADLEAEAPANSSDHTIAPSPAAVATTSRSVGRRLAYVLALLGVLLALGGAIYATVQLSPAQKPPAATPAASLRVATLPTEGPGDPDAAWIRLGIMDLIANRLRAGGLLVPPSESVLALLRADGSAVQAVDVAAFRTKAQVNLVLQSRATRTPEGWKLELRGTDAGGHVLTASSEGRTAVDAALGAADRMLDVLGRPALRRGEDPPRLNEILQRSKAAYLMNELDAARAILASAPPELHEHVLVRLNSARIETRAGQFDLAESILRELLNRPATAADTATRVEILQALGVVEVRREHLQDAEHYFQMAFDALSGKKSDPALMGRVLANLAGSHIMLNRLDTAAPELMHAKDLLQYAGDWLNVARVEAHFGAMDIGRLAFADALPRLTHASAQFETYGALNEWAIATGNLLIVQRALLRWSDGLATSDRAAQTVGRITDRALQSFLQISRAEIMFGLGRWREADVLLAAAGTSELPAERDVVRSALLVQGDLALARDAFDTAQKLSRQVLDQGTLPEFWKDEHDRAALTYMRALRRVRAGTAADLRLAGLDTMHERGSHGDLSPTLATAYAEWSLSRREYKSAEATLRAALATARAKGSPLDHAIVVTSLGDLLLSQHRIDEARPVIATVWQWVDQDFNCAVLAARLYKAEGRLDELRNAVARAQRLAGERPLPEDLRNLPETTQQ